MVFFRILELIINFYIKLEYRFMCYFFLSHLRPECIPVLKILFPYSLKLYPSNNLTFSVVGISFAFDVQYIFGFP